MQQNTNTAPQNSYYSFWQTLGLGLLIFLIFSIFQSVLIIAYSVYTQDFPTNNLESSIVALNGDALAIAEIPSAIIGTLLILFFVSRKVSGNNSLTSKAYLQLNTPTILQLITWLGVMVLVIIAMEATNNLLERETPEFMTQVYENTDNFTLLWIAVIIGAPIFEEFLFRGFIFEGLVNSRVGLIGAILISASTWAIIHIQYGWFEITSIFLIGIILAIAKYKTKSLYIPIAMHMLMNLVASVAMAIDS